MKSGNSARVTVMIPTFNQAAVVVDAVRSALAQTYSELEVVVGDDASTDDTPSLLARIQDPRLRVIRYERNIGRVANYQRLLRQHASGDFVVNLDGDDFYTDPFFIENAIKIFEQHDDAVIVAARVVATKSGSERLSLIPNEKSLSGVEILESLPAEEFHLMHMACVYVRTLALDLDFYRSGAISSDWESLYRLSVLGRVFYLPRTVGVWRIHETNESQSANYLTHLDNLAIWPAIYAAAEAEGMNRYLSRFLAARCAARFGLSSCITLSVDRPAELPVFIAGFFRRYGFAGALLLSYPHLLVRFLLCLAGYYRARKVS